MHRSGTHLLLVASGAATVHATFTRLTGVVHLVVAGPGAIKSKPAGLSCGSDGRRALMGCDATFPRGSTVSLRPVPTARGTFAAWAAPAPPSRRAHHAPSA